MSKYILKRIFYAALTLWLLGTITFFMMRMLPGGPFIGAKAITETTRLALEAKYGLDQPLLIQYVIYLKNALMGDFGISIATNRTVASTIAAAFPYSFDLGMRSLIFAVTFGIGLGTVAALKRGTKWDTMSTLVSVLGVSVPAFILGALLQYFLALQLNNFLYPNFGFRLFPIQGWNTELSKILPALALGLSSLATVSRLMRTSMLDVLGSDYIKTAKAKGLSQFVITWKHAMRNAILPVITVLGPIAASVLTGAFVVEKIFNIPGMGKFFVTSIQTQDYTMIAGTTLFYGAFLVIATVLVDIVYGFIDPRIRLSNAGSK